MAEAAQSVVQLHGANEFGISTRKIIGSILAVAVPVVFWFAPLNFDATSKHALAVAAFMIVAWITQPIPPALTRLVGCYLFLVLKVVKFEVTFSRVAGPTPWFL